MKNSDVAFAQIVVDTVSAALGTTPIGISKFASDVLLKFVVPATISKGFFTGNYEYNLIKNEDRLDDEIDALFTAVTNYLEII